MKVLVLIIALFLSSCAIKPSEPKIIHKHLIELPKNELNLNKNNVSIKVAYPNARRFLYSDEIIYKKENGVYGSYVSHFWGEITAKQLQFIFANALETLYQNVIIEPSMADVKLALESKIDSFEYNHFDDGFIKFSGHFFIVDLNTFKILKSTKISLTQAVKSENINDIINSFSILSQKINDELIKWLKDDL